MQKRLHSLPKRILLSLVLLIIPFVVFALAISVMVIRDSKEAIEKAVSATAQSYTDRIDVILNNTNYYLYHLLEDQGFIDFNNAQSSLNYQVSRHKLWNDVIDDIANQNIVNGFFFCREDKDDLLSVVQTSQETVSAIEYLKDNGYFSGGATIDRLRWNLMAINGKSYFVRILKENHTYYGVCMQLDAIVSDISEYLSYPYEELFFSQKRMTSVEKLYVSNGCTVTDLYLTLSFEPDIFIKSIARTRWFLLVIAIACVGIVPVLYKLLSKQLLIPLSELNKGHRELRHGHQEYRITEAAQSQEFAEAYESFNRMAQELVRLQTENTEKEVAHKQMLLDNLQLQIRPHFLLNTFNLLYTMIQTQNTNGAQKMILYLSDYFRYLFKYTEKLNLFSKEFKLILQYLDIMALQSPGTFTFTYDIDPELDLVRVPPLLIHNFFENIISHALVHGRVMNIMFNGTYEDGVVTLQVADDGRGMSEDDVKAINAGEAGYMKGPHLGLRNSIARLRYFYNGQGSVHVESTLNEGTIFTITFPYDLEEEEAFKYEPADGQ